MATEKKPGPFEEIEDGVRRVLEEMKRLLQPQPEPARVPVPVRNPQPQRRRRRR